MTTTKPIRKLLIANRGDVASRVMTTARRMGISCVAVFSDADADLPFVREADEAVRIGPAPAAESYLNVERVLEAAARVGADAIHPGWGFLAENAGFARAVEDAGLVFVGPTPESIESMGDKRRAKAIAAEVGVPVIEGAIPEAQDDATLMACARQLGAPLLLKAAAGGGGKGMKRLDSLDGLEEAIQSARREAEAAFGDGSLLLERYVERPRHVEIQILADGAGNVIHAYERECSIQRRHQKIIEECPSPALDHELRARMGEAAVRCAQAIGYRGVGTVEFLLAPSGEFYFLEMNTRLQVEHATTEMVTGLDLVEVQLRVARGERLHFIQDEIPLSGHALEVRLYAEDPAKDFLPQTGRLLDFAWESVPGLRVEAGVEEGSVVSPHYDPMLARVVMHAQDRATVIDRMIRFLSSLGLAGVATNRQLLIRALDHTAFRSGDTHTHFIQEHLAEALSARPSGEYLRSACVAATLFGFETRRGEADLLRTIPRGYRNNFHTPQGLSFESEGEDENIELSYRHLGAGRFEMDLNGEKRSVALLGLEENTLRWEDAGVRRRSRVVRHELTFYVTTLDACVSLRQRPRFPEREVERVVGACIAPMPGRVLSLRVAVGDRVEAGQGLAVLEAMKMEHSVRAPHAGEVVRVDVTEGDQVEADALLFVIRADEGDAPG
ncbi:MAG: ATP-grasp domain-containing protein [Deltaproteobacteria bacterium]|nr:ATP-grasp domain-containing protein [Deltaproteobacteria bacterium]